MSETVNRPALLADARHGSVVGLIADGLGTKRSASLDLIFSSVGISMVKSGVHLRGDCSADVDADRCR